MKTKTFWIKLTLVVLMLLFIWGNSMLSGDISGRMSGFVLKLTEPVVSALQRLLEGRGLTLPQEYLVRKLAHFSEYAVLGVLMLMLLVRPGVRVRPLLSAALCLAAALLDEGIQMLAVDRGPSLSDVLLDFSGACLGIAAASLILCLIRALRRSGRQRKI